MAKRSFSYRGFCNWVTILNRFYYPKHKYVGMENIPADGNAVVMVGNHQNCMMDPLNVEVALRDRKAFCLVRGDIFRVNKWFTKFLHWLGLLPVNRLNFEGLQGNGNAKEANKGTFSEARKWLAKGNTLILFPEAGHQNKRWLGYFSLGYLTLAFEAAEESGFEKEVYIMPFGHHYGNYFHARYGFVLRFGKPIALSPYYEQYKEKPRTTMRLVNELVEKQIGSLMLNIRDLDHYTAIDALRLGEYGHSFAMIHGKRPDDLVEKLEADQMLADTIENRNGSLDELQTVETEALNLGLRDWVLDRRPGLTNLMARICALVILTPVALACLPAWPVILLPRIMFGKKINGAIDDMFRSTWNFGFAALVTMPIMWVLVSLVLLCIKWWVGVAYLAIFPLMVWFLVAYSKMWRKACGVKRYVALGMKGKQMSDRREKAIKELFEAMKEERN